MRGVIFISDARMEYAAGYLAGKGIGITSLYAGELNEQMGNVEAAALDFAVLPVRGAQNGLMEMEGQIVDGTRLFMALPERALLFTGYETPYLKQLPQEVINYVRCSEQGRRVNSRLAAEGVLYLLLGKTPESLFDYSYDLLGMGYTGQEIYKLLTGLGIKVRTVDRTPGKAELTVGQWQSRTPSRIIINTIPVLTVTMPVLERCVPGSVVLDISSARAGTDARAAGMKNLTYLPAPGLPGLVAPETEGRSMAKTILEVMTRKEKEAGR